jgi:hypothetical protein
MALIVPQAGVLPLQPFDLPLEFSVGLVHSIKDIFQERVLLPHLFKLPLNRFMI